jgi:hypothetical protein
MSNQYVRMMLAQMFLVFIAILFVGLVLKAHIEPLPDTAFPVLFRNYGFLLLALPATWCIWAILQSRPQTHGTREEFVIGITGVALCILLLFLGWIAVRGAWPSTIIVATPRPTPAPASSPHTVEPLDHSAR